MISMYRIFLAAAGLVIGCSLCSAPVVAVGGGTGTETVNTHTVYFDRTPVKTLVESWLIDAGILHSEPPVQRQTDLLS